MEAMAMINRGLIEVGQGMIPDSFETYGRCFHHLETGKKYWKIKTIILPHRPYIVFDVEGWFIENYPDKTIYEPEYIYQLAREQENF